MRITAANQSKIQSLLQAASEQANLVQSVSLEVADSFVSPKINVQALINDNDWPTAVDPQLLVDPDNEKDKQLRAAAIVNIFFTEPIENRTIADFGCGEGHLVRELARRNAALAVGYDPAAKPETGERYIITNDKAEFLKHQYDSVMCFDVMDHIMDKQPEEALAEVVKVAKSGAIFFVRCHPWCSRHGTHLYQKINKAFIHMVVSEGDLKSLGYDPHPVRKVIHPLITYDGWFRTSGLQVISSEVTREPVESFFQQFSDEIKWHWKTSHDPALANGSQFPTFQMEQQFVDYVLRKP